MQSFWLVCVQDENEITVVLRNKFKELDEPKRLLTVASMMSDMLGIKNLYKGRYLCY